jgi:NitT/TauT family transport system permease protein
MKDKLYLWFLLILFFVIWEFLVPEFPKVRYFISTPLNALHYGLDNWNNILISAAITFFEAMSGFLIAIIISFLVVIYSLYYPKILRLLVPFAIVSQIMPIVTLAPLFIVVFGMGITSKIAMVVMMSFFPIFINFLSGIDGVEKNIKELLYIYDTKMSLKIFRIIIPLCTRNIFAGIKISTTMALMGAIVAEFVGAKDGLGKNLYLAPKSTNPDLMICSIILVTFIGWILFELTTCLEKRLGYWYINENKV